MLILFLAFGMCLVYTLGDIHDGYQNPITTALTLFLAVIGEVDFDGFSNGKDSSTAVIYFGIIIVVTYVVIGSLVFLNLLIAMMAKTFDTIQEDTTAAIIFARFALALELDTTAAFMPPPLNVLTMLSMALFYLFEMAVNGVRWLAYRGTCKKLNSRLISEDEITGPKDIGKKVFSPFDFACPLMPTFMVQRKLELDEQILFKRCGQRFLIMTNKGLTDCKIVRYKSEITQHYVEFYKDDEDGKECRIRVSVNNRIEKQHGWWLDLLDLTDLGLIDLEQFNNVQVNQTFTNIAHGSMHAHGEKTPYWICGFCRGYVKGSKVSIKRLCRALQVADLEQKLISKVSPEICPNCYRVRLERERWELIWEISSIWIFYLFVFPMLMLIFGFMMLTAVLTDPEQFGQAMDKMRKMTATAATGDDDDDDEEEDTVDDAAADGPDDDNDKEKKYALFHYKDTQLLAHMNEMSTEDNLFDGNVRDDIWHLLAEAKDDIDALVLSDKISQHIMRLSTEDELTKYEFCDGFVDMDKLKQNGGDELWNEYFRPLSMVMFNRIQELRHNWIPLHLCAKYPFEVQLVLDDFAQYFDEKGIEESSRGNKSEILLALASLKFLDGQDKDDKTNKNERKFILTTLEESIEDNKKKKRKKKKKKKRKKKSNADSGYADLTATSAGDGMEESAIEDSAFGSVIGSEISGSFNAGLDGPGGGGDDSEVYDKFVDYLYDVQALFQETRKIKNMLRDVSTAIVERGISGKVFQDQIYFLFEDVPDATLSIPFFNAMRLERIRGELKVGLWTIRNTLKVLYFINNCVQKQLLGRHPRVYVQKEELTHKIYKQFSNDISDPDGLTDMIYTPDMDALEEMKQKEDEDNDGMEKMKSMERNKSSMEVDEGNGDDDADDGMTEQERQAQIRRRMDLFQKEEITARAVSREVSAIFDKIQASRSNKITETTLDHYRRNALCVRLLEDDESLRYIFEQLSRYATFYPSKMKQECSPDLLKEILVKTTKFHEEYDIDRETIPSIIQERLPAAFKSCPVCHKINVRPLVLTQIRIRCVNEQCKSMERKRKKTGIVQVPSKLEKKEEKKEDDNGHIVSINIAPKIKDNSKEEDRLWIGEWCYLCSKQWVNDDPLTGEKICGNPECKSTKTAPKEIACPKCKEMCPWTEETGRKTECENDACDSKPFCWTCLKPWINAGTMVCGNDCFEITCRADRYIKQLYDHIYEMYKKADFSDEIMKQTLPYLTLEDTLSILMLYERVFSTLSTKLVARTDTFVATHDIFCKFVDPQGFSIEKNKQYWSNKTKAASELFQSVLDEQQNFITLGQVSQTVDKLMHDIHVMDCGELARVMNHLFAKVQKDGDRCVKQREEYVAWQKSKQGKTYLQKKKDRESVALDEKKESDLSTVNESGGKHVALKTEVKQKGKKNPGLSFAHVGNRQWNGFVAKIADSFEMNVRSKKISEKLLGHEYDEKKAEDLANQETERKKKNKQRKNTENLNLGRSTSASEEFGLGDDEEKKQEKKIIEAILDNTAFDIILRNQQKYAEIEDANQVGELLEAALIEQDDISVRKLRKKRNDVFDTMLSFNSGRITLQQLFSFSRSFRRFLKMNSQINGLMKKYRKLIKNKLDPQEAKLVKAQYKTKRVNATFEGFEKSYFSLKYFPKSSKKPVNLEQYAAEISWLYYNTENEYDLCHRMYPFWAGSIIKDIDAFMESTEQIQGIYELKAAEFGQLKHSLNVNDELAERLFHIIRFKIRTLSWSECYHFFVFVLKMKYNVQKAIVKSTQAEDTTVSMDGMKAILQIASNDEAVWLFNKVDSLHGAKVTWKQMLAYLGKMVAVRDDMRDFFSDQERDRSFEEVQAELVTKIADNVEDGNHAVASGTHQMLKALKQQKRQIDAMMDIMQKQQTQKDSNKLSLNYQE